MGQVKGIVMITIKITTGQTIKTVDAGDLQHANLQHANLQGANLCGVNLHSINLRNAVGVHVLTQTDHGYLVMRLGPMLDGAFWRDADVSLLVRRANIGVTKITQRPRRLRVF